VTLLTLLACGVWACTDDAAGVEAGVSDDAGTSNTGTSNTGTSNTGTSNTGTNTTEGGGETGDTGGTGGDCKTSVTTEVEGCPEVVGMGFCSEGGVHVEQDSEIEWTNNPPHSGDHYPTWATWGEHDTPVPRGNWVHNLEHGGIVLLHNCPEPCDAELEVLREVLGARPDSRVLMTPDPLLDGPRFAAVSWTWVHEFDSPDLDELLCFIDQHFDHAPESVP
jgi:hypothetical protein